MQAADESETAASLDSALEEIDRLDHLASSLLVLARTRAAGPPPDRAFGLRDAVDRAVQDALAVRRPAGDPVAVRVEGDLEARGDAQAMERAVRNLVENALRHARTEVAVSMHRDDGDAILRVRDDGPGFPPDLLVAGVDRFTPGDNPANHGGAGLGLAIVDAITRAHGGTLVLTNDRGASAELRFPLVTTAPV
ncbi:MAG: HAMP domain-containing sensor histidine kinase [Acidimicrobiia bacterium]